MQANRIAAIVFVLFGGLLLAGVTHAAMFPDVDYSKLSIRLQRSACFGECPDYVVTIAGDGAVVFKTGDQAVDPTAAIHRQYSRSGGVLVTGTHKTRIDTSAVRSLVEQFRDAGFFGLRNTYQYSATDAPTYVLSIDTGNGKKQIIDYIGRQAGMPASVTALEDAVDKAAGTNRWIEGSPEVIPLLQAEGVKFNSELGFALMAKAAERGDVQMMTRLYALGAPVSREGPASPLWSAAYNHRVEALDWLLNHGAGDSREALISALEAAVSGDNDEAFKRLRERAGSVTFTPELATTLLREAAGNGNVHIVSYLLGFRPRLNGSDDDRPLDDPPLWKAAQNSCPTDSVHPSCDHRKVVRLLLDAGADARWFSKVYRNSVFFQVEDPEIARMLLAAGADPNFKDSEGEPIIFSISNEDVALVMLDAGLNPKSVRPADKKTLREWAIYEKWPRVVARLDRAGP